MTSKLSPFLFGLLLVAIVSIIQSAPIDPIKDTIQSSKKTEQESVKSAQSSIISASPTSTVLTDTSTTIASALKNIKKRRFIDSYEHSGDFSDESSNENDEVAINNRLYTNMKEEQPTGFYGKVDKPVDTVNRNLYTDIVMDPDEYMNLARKRRSVNLNFGSNRRRKRALTLYDLYNNDPFYESLLDREQYIRPTRAYAPIYIPSSAYERNVRSAFAPYFYELPEWNKFYANSIDNNQIPTPFSLTDDDNEDEYIRFPLFSGSSDIPYDNLQLQQAYNIDDVPIDQDDVDGDGNQHLFMPYDPIESYYK